MGQPQKIRRNPVTKPGGQFGKVGFCFGFDRDQLRLDFQGSHDRVDYFQHDISNETTPADFILHEQLTSFPDRVMA